MIFLVALWVIFEWSKSWVLTGFPWLDIGYTQTSSWLFNLAPIGGVYLVGFAVCAIAVALIFTLSNQITAIFRISTFAVTGLVFVISAWLSTVDWSIDEGNDISVGIVQPNTLIETKWQSAYRDQVISRLASESANLASSSSQPVDLIVWPETALALSYQQTDDDFWRAIVPQGSALISGLVDLPNLDESYNAAILVCGDQRTIYRKRHLVPFGEYLPLRFLFNWVLEYLQLPMSDFSSWQEPQNLACGNDLRIGLSICYEDAFANEHRVHNSDASILVNISEDAWFGDSLAPHQRLQMAQMRAYELSRPMVRSANSGPSAFIDHKGRVLQKTAQFSPASLIQTVKPQSGITPFQRFGNWIVWFCFTVVGVGLLWRWRSSRTPDSH